MCRSLFWWIIFKRWFLQGFGRKSNHGWCHRIRIGWWRQQPLLSQVPSGGLEVVRRFWSSESSSRVCNVNPPPKKNRPFWAEIWHPFPEGVGWCFWNPALLCHLSARQPCLKSVACCPGAAAAGWSSIHHVNILLTRDPSRLKLVYFSTFISKLRFVWLDLYKMHPGNLT